MTKGELIVRLISMLASFVCGVAALGIGIYLLSQGEVEKGMLFLIFGELLDIGAKLSLISRSLAGKPY